MIEKLWYGKTHFYWLLMPLSWLYGLITLVRRQLYKTGILKSWKSPVPIIVIGNLSVGGNGKTPLVIELIEALKAKGLKIGVVSRGYGGKAESYPLILDEQTTTAQAGDEPVLIYQRTHVPVAVSRNRSQAVQALLDNYQLDAILTDDGLQHYALKRDIEIVVVDGKRLFGNGWWIPAGPMRERQSRLKSVDIIIINGETKSHLAEKFPEKTYTMQLKPQYAVNLLTKEKIELHLLKNICAMAGIGDPNRFFTMLNTLKADVIKTVPFADHQKYTLPLLANIATQDQILLMTEKDAVKCFQFTLPNWWYLPIEAILPNQVTNQICSLLEEIKSKRE